MSTGTIARFETTSGVRIYRIPIRTFPQLVTNIHIVIADDYVALIDTGSGLEESNKQLQSGLATLREDWGETLDWADFKRIIITHSHIDHYGGLGFVVSHTNAPVAVHELDRRVLVNHQERLVLASRALSSFLWRAGVSEESHTTFMGMYAWSKGLFRSIDISTILHDGDLLDGMFRVYHTPGHCPGQVCLQLDDVLFSADHILWRTSPHISPESLTPWNGLDHYFQSLQKIATVPNIRLALAGHEQPIETLNERINAIEQSHQYKLERILDICTTPHTIKDLSREIYAKLDGYNILLALTEVGAHIEYLDQRGELAIANLDDVSANERVAPKYRRA